MSAASGDFSAHALERYGLQLVEEPEPCEANLRARPPRSADWPALCLFHWSLLGAFAVIQLAYLAGLGLCLRWALQRLIGV